MTISTATKTPGERMLDKCLRCDDAERGGVLRCRRLGRPIVMLAVRGRRFCPVGKHDDIEPGRGRATPVPAPAVARNRRPRLRFYATAAAKLSLALLRLCRTPDDELTVRRAACRLCSKLEHKRLLGLIPVRICGICRCWMPAKTALATERCPIKHKPAWLAVPGKRCGPPLRLPLVRFRCAPCNFRLSAPARRAIFG